ncbi:MAG: hypothetical protein O9267_03775 [Flavobacterium sp.]|uniref:hypothetical protein n=1 Tax=Flavobacterium sp. TaxID=239 RepID=UPI0022C79C65|nr:hypothetical protein [Flavobacterium sp.]MCZ8196710.1 hypothetical protein [Flavobacterium sp.]
MKSNLFFLAVFTASFVSCNNDDDMPSTIPVESEFKLVTASNTSGKVTLSDLSQITPSVMSFMIPSTDADGVYYDSDLDEIVLASRTNNVLEVYGNVDNAIMSASSSLTLSYSSTSNFNNPREIAVSGNKVVVTQDQNAANSNTNKLLVYQKTSNGFTLLNDYTVDFKNWGIFLDGNTLYATADLTGDIIVFENFFSNANGTITPTKRITIEGLVRTHGIFYSAKDNRMILTDVGSATSDNDGGLIVINNFSSIVSSTANLGTISMSNQMRVYGPNSSLGNPVDVAYDYETNNIYIAERLKDGGKLLTFSMPTTNADMMPINSRLEPGISSVYLLRK